MEHLGWAKRDLVIVKELGFGREERSLRKMIMMMAWMYRREH
jgi:hypothetical protein